MNKIYLLLILAVTSCSSKLDSKILNKQQKLNPNELIVVLDWGDEQEINGIKIGEIGTNDYNFSSNCSYYEIIDSFKNLARKNGANIIQITKHEKAENWNICERIAATIYKVDNCKIYERKIEWTNNRLLTWDDFKGKVPENKINTRIAAETFCRQKMQSNRVTLLKDSKFFIKNIFDCDFSWVKPEHTSNELLKHEQGHFDLSEIYTRILRAKLNTQQINISNLNNKPDSIFQEVSRNLSNKQKEYDRQTDHGLNKENQKKWDSHISLKLDLKR